MDKPWQQDVTFMQRRAADAHTYAAIARDLYDASITPNARRFHYRSWMKASHVAMQYARDARALFSEWIGE